MSKLNPHLIWAVALVLTLGAPGSIVAWNLTRQPTAIVEPTPAPDSLSVQVRELTADYSDEDRQFLIDHYRSLIALAAMGTVRDTEQLRDTIGLARVAVYGNPNLLGDKAKALNQALNAECVSRGLLAPDVDKDGRPDEVKPFDAEAWQQYCVAVLEGLQ